MSKLLAKVKVVSRLFGIHIWKSMRQVEDWVTVEKGVKVKVIRWETPEEYHARKNDMVTICLFGKLITFKIPGR